jgi:hypothetical protein
MFELCHVFRIFRQLMTLRIIFSTKFSSNLYYTDDGMCLTDILFFLGGGATLPIVQFFIKLIFYNNQQMHN